MSSAKSAYIAVIGVGGIGSLVLAQVADISLTYSNISVVLISRSTKCLFVSDFNHSLSLSTWESDLSASKQPVLDPQEILEYLLQAPGRSIIVDNTSNQAIAEKYPQFLRAGISVVTPNKKAFSSSWELWQDIFDSVYSPKKVDGGLVYHEATVGAGLPVISTLKDLVATGDEVQKIEGVFSGTMSFLFNAFSPVEGKSGKWSEEVRKAKELGFTEPDPRDDLNGMDVARKLVILARLSGLQIQSPGSFPVQSLIPQALEKVASAGEFLARLGEFDADMEKVKTDAEKQGKVVRFVGSVEVVQGKAKVGLETFEKSHPIAALKGSDNIFNFYTKRYGDRPMIIQGSGAGAPTAMGVTGDIIKVVQRIQ